MNPAAGVSCNVARFLAKASRPPTAAVAARARPPPSTPRRPTSTSPVSLVRRSAPPLHRGWVPLLIRRSSLSLSLRRPDASRQRAPAQHDLADVQRHRSRHGPEPEPQHHARPVGIQPVRIRRQHRGRGQLLGLSRQCARPPARPLFARAPAHVRFRRPTQVFATPQQPMATPMMTPTYAFATPGQQTMGTPQYPGSTPQSAHHGGHRGHASGTPTSSVSSSSRGRTPQQQPK